MLKSKIGVAILFIFLIVSGCATNPKRFGNLIETRDGGGIISGSVLLGKDDGSMFFARFNPNGQLAWKTVVKSESAGTFSMPPIILDMKKLNHEEFIAIGSQSSTSNDGFLSKFSTIDGTEIYTTNTMKDGKKCVPQLISRNSNGGYTLFGVSEDEKLWALQVNKDGEVVTE